MPQGRRECNCNEKLPRIARSQFPDKAHRTANRCADRFCFAFVLCAFIGQSPASCNIIIVYGVGIDTRSNADRAIANLRRITQSVQADNIRLQLWNATENRSFFNCSDVINGNIMGKRSFDDCTIFRNCRKHNITKSEVPKLLHCQVLGQRGSASRKRKRPRKTPAEISPRPMR